MRTTCELALVLMACVLAVSGCKKKEAGTEHTAREKPVFHLDEQAQPAATQAGDASALPPGHPPIGATQSDSLPPGHPPIGSTLPEGLPPVGQNGAGETGADKELSFTAPEGWTAQPPRPMTRMVYKLPAVEGDPADADLTVSTLAARAIALAMNVERWCGQFELPAGKTCADFSTPTPIEGAHHSAVLVEMHGAYKGSMTGAAPAASKPDYTMLAAIIDGPGNQWYVKLVGPSKTVEHWRASFMDFVRQAQ